MEKSDTKAASQLNIYKHGKKSVKPLTSSFCFLKRNFPSLLIQCVLNLNPSQPRVYQCSIHITSKIYIYTHTLALSKINSNPSHYQETLTGYIVKAIQYSVLLNKKCI